MSEQNVIAGLARMMKSSEFSDLTILCNGKTFHVHKAIVCAQSPVLREDVRDASEKSCDNFIEMHGFRPETVKRLVEFMYTGQYSSFEDEKDKKSEAESSVSAVSNDLDCKRVSFRPITKANNPGLSDALVERLALKAIALMEIMENRGSVSRPDGSNDENALDEGSDDDGNVLDEGSDDDANDDAMEPTLPEPKLIHTIMSHIHVNAIAHHYKVGALQTLANETIDVLLKQDEDGLSWKKAFPLVVSQAFELTGDKNLLEILAEAAMRHGSALADSEDFEQLDAMSGFSFALFKAYAHSMEDAHVEMEAVQAELHSVQQTLAEAEQQVQELTAQVTQKDKNHELQMLCRKQQVADLVSPIDMLNKTRHCKSCKAGFACRIEGGLLICAGCRYKHQAS